FDALAEAGFAGIVIPEEYDGAGLGNIELAIVIEEVNRACASTGVTLSVHNSLTGVPILKFGNDAQKRQYLPKLATGEWLGAYALSEPWSGSDAAALTCTAERNEAGDHYVLNGTKRFITSGDRADLMVLMARTDDSHKQKGISAFIVEKTFEGFQVGRREEKMGLRASSTVDIVLENCKVPAENRLGEEGQGFTIALATLDGGRIGIAAQAVGIAQACLDASIKYAKEREQFGRPITPRSASSSAAPSPTSS
ncbi:MAG: acyl-CoA dehydrogenase family protein, partial [Planctomycetota bacterium]